MLYGRRNFENIEDDFLDECVHVLNTLGEVYHNDTIAKQEAVTPAQPLHLHQTESGPLMDELLRWLKNKIDRKEVEPISALGKAI